MEIISMMDIKVQHRDPSIQISPLLTIPVSVIPESSLAPTTTIPPPIPPFISPQQQSTPIPTPTTTEATTLTTAALDFETLSAIHLRVSDLEKEVKELKNVDYSSALRATIKSEVPTTIKEYLGTSLDDALCKHKALYHALMESILADEDAMDKGVADIQKKRKPDDADRDEDPPAGPNQGKSAQAEETVFEAGDTQVPQDLGEDMGNTDDLHVVKADLKDWFKKSKRPPTPDLEWNEGKTVDNKPTQKWLSDLAKAETSSKTFDDLMSTPIDFSTFFMNRLQISDLTQDILVGPAYKLLKGTCRSFIEFNIIWKNVTKH
ncbi:hypothetical protein Tco_1088829 [Tanacetum coccineum]